ncbi:unnamed protein product [Parajaminaea phylloscopi]
MMEGWFGKAKPSSRPEESIDKGDGPVRDSSSSSSAEATTPMPEGVAWSDWDDHEETPEEEAARIRVEGWRDQLFRSSPMIRFMTRHLMLVSCDPFEPVPEKATGSEASRVSIIACPPNLAGGFTPGDSKTGAGLAICANRILDKKHLEETLAHEMIHWWDHCRFKVDWSDPRHHACAEIRAASLSGDCRMGREWTRGNYAFTKQHQACVRRRAILSLMGRDDCAQDPHKAEKAVDEVFDKCFADTRPFDEIY